MIPSEDIRTTYYARTNTEGKLVTIPSVRKEKKIIKRHVKLPKVHIISESHVVSSYAFDGPNKAKAIFASHPVRF